ncbi:MAG: glucose 1-dehydrogenase [Myxococcales bacterium]|nr:glucose 1-dehydrogenase [Myxococcales bacterium]
MRLQDRIAVVTGGGSGIGRSICEAYAREGAKLAVLDLNEATAKETAHELPGKGHQSFACDVASGPGVVEAFAAVDAAFGRVDVLVNNAGIDRAPGDGMDQLMQTGQVLVHMSDEGFTRLMEVNVNGVFFCSREAVKLMQREGRGGVIVNMSSIAGLSAQGPPHYAASKSAVLGITRACARELGRFQIRVNAICPGVIDTPMSAGIPEAALGPLLAATPLGRKGLPQDIAAAAVYLASEESSFVTGQWLSPNGGLVMV